MPSKKQQRIRKKKANYIRKKKEWKKTLKNLKYLPEELRLNIFHFVGVRSVFEDMCEYIPYMHRDGGVSVGTPSALRIGGLYDDLVWKSMSISKTMAEIHNGELMGLMPVSRRIGVCSLLNYSSDADWYKWGDTIGKALISGKPYIELFRKVEEEWIEIRNKLIDGFEEEGIYLNHLSIENYMVFKFIAPKLFIGDMDEYTSINMFADEE